MSDAELIESLRDWPYQGETMANAAADRIEQLNERLTAATDDAKEAEAYAEQLEAKLAECEARLGKAVEALETIVDNGGAGSYHLARATLAELEGK
jgi:predicted  nucleic acid-binding Zn-ribbon protein